MLFSLILISIEKPGTKIKKKNAHLNFDLKWVNVTLLLHFFENHPYALPSDLPKSLFLCTLCKKNIIQVTKFYVKCSINTVLD